ncbi:MAG: hypothetical protein A3I02_15300 [Betaproteobacteria bacterium RIFCSPLOWO2_02_FULL_67_26]|nr:MAG: hypothetical protein A3I02_15300 [Betaproteobacteria bacterium RIFCSPLOWO2_02_FULL_67_26]
MSCLFKSSKAIAIMLAASTAAGVVNAQSGLTPERFGLGLKARSDAPSLHNPAFGSEAAQVWQATRSSEFALIGGMRDAPRLGLRAVESYGGIAYAPPGGWGTSFEAGFARETLDTPRRYSLGGQMHTALSNGRTFSVGLKYRAFDVDSGLRPALSGETPAAHAYTLAPLRVPGAAFGPSYQLQMSYQHSSTSAFGLALGREVETFTPYLDASSAGRQLTFTGQHLLTPSWALSYDVLSSDPANPLRFQGLGLRLGMRYRF